MEPSADIDRVDRFHQRPMLLFQVIALLGSLLLLVCAALIFGPGIEPDSWQIVWVPVAALTLAVVTFAFAWMLWKRPAVLRVDKQGIYLPIVFKEPLAWSHIHRIRLQSSKAGLYGTRHWIVIDPSPGVLAPLRLPVWRWLELKLQKHHGVRIPLHGLDAAPDEVVASIERFRPVQTSDP